MDRKVATLVRMLPSNQDRSKWHSLPVWYIWNKLYVMSVSIRDNGYKRYVNAFDEYKPAYL